MPGNKKNDLKTTVSSTTSPSTASSSTLSSTSITSNVCIHRNTIWRLCYGSFSFLFLVIQIYNIYGVELIYRNRSVGVYLLVPYLYLFSTYICTTILQYCNVNKATKSIVLMVPYVLLVSIQILIAFHYSSTLYGTSCLLYLLMYVAVISLNAYMNKTTSQATREPSKKTKTNAILSPFYLIVASNVHTLKRLFPTDTSLFVVAIVSSIMQGLMLSTILCIPQMLAVVDGSIYSHEVCILTLIYSFVMLTLFALFGMFLENYTTLVSEIKAGSPTGIAYKATQYLKCDSGTPLSKLPMIRAILMIIILCTCILLSLTLILRTHTSMITMVLISLLFATVSRVIISNDAYVSLLLKGKAIGTATGSDKNVSEPFNAIISSNNSSEKSSRSSNKSKQTISPVTSNKSDGVKAASNSGRVSDIEKKVRFK